MTAGTLKSESIDHKLKFSSIRATQHTCCTVVSAVQCAERIMKVPRDSALPTNYKPRRVGSENSPGPALGLAYKFPENTSVGVNNSGGFVFGGATRPFNKKGPGPALLSPGPTIRQDSAGGGPPTPRVANRDY
jgi:hypothetical protein